MTTPPTQPFYVDLNPFLPETWREDLEKFAATEMFRVQQDEGGPGSIGYKDSAAIDYHTALKPEIASSIPWVPYLHEQVIPVLMGLRGLGGLKGDPRAGEDTLIPIQSSHGLVMNVFTPDRKGIEWHRDGADVFLNVILSTGLWNYQSGGRLMTHDGEKVSFWSLDRPGHGAVILTGDLPHSVERLHRDEARRLTLLFSYTNPERESWREDQYNEHFYAGRD